ncbi:MAG TPA: sugar ABC transporter substrate-binding protein [Patescibacteria group bacterium]|nr:sugar ABC transporter substrate-binding protein [Patescibacteria group bacterium]
MNRKYYIIGGVILFLIIIIVVLLVATSGKKPQAAGPITLTWWKTFETSDNVQQLIADYEKTHKNVTINYVKKDETTYEQDLLEAYASGTAPDILSIHNDWLPQEADKLAPDPTGDVRSYKTTFVDVAADDFIKDNQIFAVPMNVDVMALYYNKDILNSANVLPPKTWSELVSDVPKITQLTKPGTFTRSGIAFGTAANVNRAVDIMSLLMLQNGTQFYNDSYSGATFDQTQTSAGGDSVNPGAVALQYYTQFADPAKTVYTWNARSDNNVDSFTQGRVGMMLSYFYMEPQIQSKAPTLNWDVAPVPQPSTDSVQINFANYWGEAVNKNSPNVQAAWDFLNFITSHDELSAYYKQHQLVSSRKDILQTQMSDPTLGVFAEEALSAKSVYKKDADGFETVFSKMIDDVSQRGLTPEEAATNAAQQIDLQLQQH